jgi:hypothetical protein
VTLTIVGIRLGSTVPSNDKVTVPVAEIPFIRGQLPPPLLIWLSVTQGVCEKPKLTDDKINKNKNTFFFILQGFIY